MEGEKVKILFLLAHCSTGGMPAFVLKSVQTLYKTFEIEVVEYQCHSLDYVVQRNQIKELVPFHTLHEDKMELFNIIAKFNPDIVHIHEPAERFNRDMISELYREDRSYRIVETCHDVSFNHDKEKIFHPDAYYFCTPYHLETFASSPSYKEVIEFPIDDKRNRDYYDNPFDTKRKNVVNVGLWTPGKNQAEGIEIARKYPDMDFHFIGNQAINFKHYWEPLMKDLPSNVHVWLERNDAHRFIKMADIFMFNSTWECNPLVLREAISFGKPIIAHNLPQYGSMFSKYIQPIDTDLNTIKCNYIIPTDNTSQIFWEKQIAFYNKVMTLDKQEQDVKIIQHFVGQPYLEIKSGLKADFKVQYFDGDKLVYENTIGSNSWVKLNRQYYTEWESKVFMNDKLIHNDILSLEGKRVYIALSSKSLGDTIAWAPYAYEFQKKHKCKVILSTFLNKILDIPEIELVEPGTVVPNIYAQYNIGWFYDSNKEPELPNTIKLQEAATKILGLDFQEIMPKLKYDAGENNYGKYVTIATNSTSGCKFWTKEGWQGVINYLHEKGYKVINVSLEENPFDNCEQIINKDIQKTMAIIHHSQFSICLGSGVAWLANAIGKQVVMINNFAADDHEFECIRVTNKSVCNSCWNNPNFKFDASDWDFCPIWKNTPRHFECQRSIVAEDVIDRLVLLLD
jgi:autotransporter strand-loop-strand O-heptosyltransferase